MKPTRKNPARRSKPTNITLDPAVKNAAIAYVSNTGYDSLSEWVAALLERELQHHDPELFKRCAAEVEQAAKHALAAAGPTQSRAALKRVVRGKDGGKSA